MENRNSSVSSTPTTVDQSTRILPVPRPQEDKHEMDPWTPLVLSLDGGGVRGLSSLLILRRIMLRVRELEAAEAVQTNPSEPNYRLPLPCHYFDNIVGTSAGGLIVVMLGRLRMDVNECIQQYLVLCNRIFRPHKHIRHYSTQKFESAINEVISKYCKCHAQGCLHPHTHYLRQYDYLEFDEIDPDDPEQARRINGTCKVAVIAQRKAHGNGQPDTVFMMRSYNHRWRPSHARTPSGLNRGQETSSALKIWEACRATAAAPFFFHRILIEGCWYIDGGVGDNNPSSHAWNEAKDMNKTNNKTNKVAMLVSIGTGMTEPNTKFGGLLSLAKYARKAITETERAHETTRNFASLVEADYFRFDVRPRRGVHDGLSRIKLDECKKKRIKQHKHNNSNGSVVTEQPLSQTSTEDDSDDDDANSVTATELANEQILAAMDAHNDLEACQPHVKGGYKPQKYNYTTFRTIKKRTDKYCRSVHYSFLNQQGPHEAQNVKDEIYRCARILFESSQRRRENDAERWRRFRHHPDPQHEANRADPPREA